MDILIDTSILGRVFDPADPQYGACQNTLKALDTDHSLVITPQIIIELCSVATRPTNVNGLGLSPEQMAVRIQALEKAFELRCPGIDEYEIFKGLYQELKPSGKRVHDVRHLAALKSLGLRAILTLNPKDFATAEAAEHVVVLTPDTYAAKLTTQ
jgi:predicted nucleic acid-binding protein